MTGIGFPLFIISISSLLEISFISPALKTNRHTFLPYRQKSSCNRFELRLQFACLIFQSPLFFLQFNCFTFMISLSKKLCFSCRNKSICPLQGINFVFECCSNYQKKRLKFQCFRKRQRQRHMLFRRVDSR